MAASNDPSRYVASFLVDPETRRGHDDPTAEQTRLLWIFAALLRYGQVDFLSHNRAFETSERTYKRDIARLRKIGQVCHFKLSPQQQGRVRLLEMAQHDRSLFDHSTELAELVRVVSEALGGPVRTALSPLASDAKGRREPFLRVIAPRLVESSTIARVFDALKSAAAARARVEFRYLAANRKETSRTVEPYAVVLRSGRFYLVAYDPAPRKGWRRFALDTIREPVRPAGTFKPRTIPDDAIPRDAIGLFSKGAAMPVTIALSPTVAASATCRVWQTGQKVVEHEDGSALITLRVEEPAEAIRWALGFGPEARVVSPPSAVAEARSIADRIRAAYTDQVAEGTSARSA